MSFDKYMGKDRRKKFIGAKSIDSHCRNHGDCSYCRDNRIFFDKKRRSVINEELKQWRYKNDFKNNT